MGRQIGLNAAIHGYMTTVCETVPAVRESVLDWEKDYLSSRVQKGKTPAEK